MRRIDISVDTFAALWAARIEGEDSEDDIIRRLVGRTRPPTPIRAAARSDSKENVAISKPKSSQWVDILVWSLRALGGRAPLDQIYKKAAEGRKLFGLSITRNHDAAARERLESYCSNSKNYKGIADLFCMPEGKGAGIWALCPDIPRRYQ